LIDFKCPYCGNENWNTYGHSTYKGEYKRRWQCVKCGKIIKEGKNDIREEKITVTSDDKLKDLLKKGSFSIEELSNQTGIIPKEVRKIIKELEDSLKINDEK